MTDKNKSTDMTREHNIDAALEAASIYRLYVSQLRQAGFMDLAGRFSQNARAAEQWADEAMANAKQTPTTACPPPSWIAAEVESLIVGHKQQRQKAAIYAEFCGNSRSMAAEIWRLRKEVSSA